MHSARLAEELDQRLRLLTRRLRGAGDPELSATAVSLLAHLRDAGPLRITDLAAVARVAQPSMTALVGRLEGRGLVERGADPADRRAVRVALTGDGRARLKAVHAARTAFLAERLEALGPEDRAALAAALPALDHLLQP
jgi:DNA-binding MarR family transcriptional regulator